MVNDGRTVITFTPGSYVLYIHQKIVSGAQKIAAVPSPENPKLPATPGHSGTGPEVPFLLS